MTCPCLGVHRWSDLLGRDVWVLTVVDPDCTRHVMEVLA